MGGYKNSYRVFNITLGLIAIIAYFVIEYYVIPKFVEEDKRILIGSYTTYALTGILFLLGVGSTIVEHIDESKSFKKR
jgi:hypothetical protein